MVEALEKTRYNRIAAAELLRYRIKKLGIV